MLTRAFQAIVPAVLACTFGLQPAHVDLYTWVDASGGVNVSNLAPPEGVRITKVTVAPAAKTATRNDHAREAARETEVQVLAKRIRQVEDVVAFQCSGSSYWYYCRDPAGFYPDVQICTSEWLQVVPNQTADAGQ